MLFFAFEKDTRWASVLDRCSTRAEPIRLCSVQRTEPIDYNLKYVKFAVSCGRLSWLPVSFLLHVKYTLSYRIVSFNYSLVALKGTKR